MLRSTSILVLVAFAMPAIAAELSYSYVEAGYQKIELDDSSGFSVDGDGFGIGGSFEIGDSFHVFGSYASSSFDFSVDLDEYSLGAGYHTSITNNVDAVFELAYVRAEANTPFGFSVDDDGYGASVGVRAMLGENFELAGSVNYVDLGDSDGTSFDGTARYYVTPAFALGINAGFGDDVTTYGASMQWYFGK